MPQPPHQSSPCALEFVYSLLIFDFVSTIYQSISLTPFLSFLLLCFVFLWIQELEFGLLATFTTIVESVGVGEFFAEFLRLPLSTCILLEVENILGNSSFL
jgi:hypothetical protein